MSRTRIGLHLALLIALGAGAFALMRGAVRHAPAPSSAASTPNAGSAPRNAVPSIDLPSRAADAALRPSPELSRAIDAARALPTVDARRAANIAALSEAAEREPAAATAIAAALRPLEGRDEALHETLGPFLAQDPARAFAFLHERMAHVDPETGYAFAREAAPVDPSLALALSQRLPQPQRSSAVRDACSEWAVHSATEASHHAAQIEDEEDRAAAVTAVAEVWSHDDPRAAFAWGAHFEDMETRGAALETTLSIWAESDPVAAARAALGGPRDEGHQRLLDAVLAVWAERDAESALSFIASTVREPAARDASATTVLLALAQHHPQRAAERARAWAASTPEARADAVLDKVLTAAVAWQGSHPTP